ncbi:MAG: FAD-binding oxidoreductase [Acholeplasmataceae bacterium]
MKKHVIIVGAGISGVSIAYHLAKKGVKDILVIDQGYFTNGATGRCGAGIRQQWATKMNCLMAKKSMEFFETAEKTLDYDGSIELKQEGYLILATTKDEEEQFKKNVKLQNELGIPSKVLNKEEALNIVPHLNPNAFLSATFCHTDGHLNPFKMTEAFYKASLALGVQFHFFETVKDLTVEDQLVKKVITDKEIYETDILINAAGGYAKEIGELAGVDIPVYSENHEILATEPVEKLQGPMVMSFSKNIYCQQVPHGAFLMGRSTPNQTKGHDISSSWQFLDEMSQTVCDIMPLIGKLNIVRQWGGSYNMSPDHQPIISKAIEVNNFYMACGFSGHGFMLAPMTGLLMSELVLGLKPSMDIESLSIERFNNQEAVHIEKSVV